MRREGEIVVELVLQTNPCGVEASDELKGHRTFVFVERMTAFAGTVSEATAEG